MPYPEKEPLFDGWATLHQPETPHIFMSGKSYAHDPLAPRLSRQPVPGIAVFEMFDVFRKRPLPGDRSWYGEHFSMNELSRIVLVLWRQTAIIRYLVPSFVREKHSSPVLPVYNDGAVPTVAYRSRGHAATIVRLRYTYAGSHKG